VSERCPPYCTTDKKAREEAEEEHQYNPGYDAGATVRLVSQIMVVSHAISFADLAQIARGPHVGGSSFFGGVTAPAR
jgi:hypothetical protein